MVCPPEQRDNPRALARGLSTVQAHKPCSMSQGIISLFRRTNHHSEVIIDRAGAQTMLYLTCTMISSIGLAHYRVSRAKIGYMWIVVQDIA